jgi:hypothetical protein
MDRSSEDEFLKTGWGLWIRESARIMNVISDLEKEVHRMRDRKVPTAFIEEKDLMINMIVDFFNSTDQLINAYRKAIINKNAEIMMLDDCFKHCLRTEWRDRIIKRLSSDVDELNERETLKKELQNKING